MLVEMVMNELSHQRPTLNIHTARNLISILIQTILAATKVGVTRVLRMNESFFENQLAPDYFLQNWLNDNNVDQVERAFFRTIATKIPYFQDLTESQIADQAELSEFLYEGTPANGFRYAYWLEALAISILSDPKWDSARIDNLTVQKLNEKSGDLEEGTVSVNHASRPEHMGHHEGWINVRIQDSIQDGNDLWFRRTNVYQSLLFCNSIRKQLRKLYSSNQVFQQVKQRLYELDSFCNKWQEGPFRPEKLGGRARPESETTLQQYGAERTFECPDGIERLFTWHVNLNPGAWRLYFFPEESQRKITIGYIGSHLKIATQD